MAGTATNVTPTASVLPGQPQVQILPRLENAIYREGVLVYILATVSNAGASIAQVEVLIDGVMVAQRDNPNPDNATIFAIEETWLATGTGEKTLTVAVTRTNGERGEDSIRINITQEGMAMLPQSAQTEVATPDTAISPITEQTAPTSVPLSVPTQGGEIVFTPIPPTEFAVDPNAPRALFEGNVNVRRGPGVAFVPALGILQAGDSAPIIGLNLAGDWLKIAYQGGEGWILAELVQIEGDITNLPREAGPATPVPTP